MMWYDNISQATSYSQSPRTSTAQHKGIGRHIIKTGLVKPVNDKHTHFMACENSQCFSNTQNSSSSPTSQPLNVCLSTTPFNVTTKPKSCLIATHTRGRRMASDKKLICFRSLAILLARSLCVGGCGGWWLIRVICLSRVG